MDPCSCCKCVQAIASCIQAFGLSAIIGEECHSFLCVKENWISLRRAIEDLKAAKNSVMAEVAAEENKGNVIDSEVDNWKRKVAICLKYEITEEDYNEMGSGDNCLCNCNPTVCHRYRGSKRIADKLNEVKELIEEKKLFKVFGRKPAPGMVELMPTTITFGMKPVIEKLWEYFRDEEKNIIGIWGQGGIGKTTLLTELNNELAKFNDDNKKKKDDPYFVIFIEVSNSDRLNVAGIQKMISHRLGLDWNEAEDENIRATVLAKNLRKKKFVILLDDIWVAFKLKDVGIPVSDAAKNCKIILATREKKVCDEMGAEMSLIEMPILNEEAAWELFRSKLTPDVLNAIDESPATRGYAEAIARNCGGLPLALKVIGSAMARLKDLKEWRDAVEATRARLKDIDGVDKMFVRLEYSYDRLNTELKVDECFLYCSLFPGNAWIKKDQLVDYWMAEGLVSSDHPSRGRSNIRSLADACLLQYNDSHSEVKLHDVIRHLGLSIATEQRKFLVKAGLGLEDAPEPKDWKKAARISLMSNDIKVISISPKCSNLRTLLLQNNPNLDRLSPEFFRSMSSLRVLDLSYTSITELPECGALVKLQYLNLSHTRIIRLPENYWILKRLMHLDLSVTSALDDISVNFSKLLKLRVLNLFRSNCGIRNVNDLNIDNLERLKFLGIAVHSQDVLCELKKNRPLARSTHCLSLKYCERLESIQISELPENLEELYIEFCNDLKKLTGNANDQQNSCLQVLTLAFLPNLDEISVGKVPHCFQMLRNLTIYNCHKIDNVSWVLELGSLEILDLSHCDGMIQIVKEMQSEDEEVIEQRANEVIHYTDFPKLRFIILNDLKLLESICNARDFPFLESITVEVCPSLRRLPLGRSHKAPKLRKILGSSEWWNKLNREDKNTKANLDGYFMPI